MSSNTLTQAESGPTPAATQRYREMVFAAGDEQSPNPDPAILENSWKLDLDFREDLKVYRSRLAASEDLNKRVPELQAEAHRLADVAAKAASIGTRPVSDFPTVRELLVALNSTASHSVAGAVSPEKLAASQAAGEVGRVRHSATTLLRETADPALGRQIAELSNEASSLESAIRSREELLHIDRAITECKAKIAQYAADDRTFNAEPMATRRVSSAELYLKARRRLEGLCELAAQRPAAEAANAADQARIVELRIRVNKLEARRLDPREMTWHA